jgi:hypothetical protein
MRASLVAGMMMKVKPFSGASAGTPGSSPTA